jgi:hypothetical protein
VVVSAAVGRRPCSGLKPLGGRKPFRGIRLRGSRASTSHAAFCATSRRSLRIRPLQGGARVAAFVASLVGIKALRGFGGSSLLAARGPLVLHRPWFSELFFVVRGRSFFFTSLSAPKGSVGNILEATEWDWPVTKGLRHASGAARAGPHALAAGGLRLGPPCPIVDASIIRSFFNKDFSAADFHGIGRWGHNLPDISRDLAWRASAHATALWTCAVETCRKVSSFVAGRKTFTLQRGQVRRISGTSTAPAPSPSATWSLSRAPPRRLLHPVSSGGKREPSVAPARGR